MRWHEARAEASPAGPQRSGAQKRFYVGRRAELAEVYFVTARDVERMRQPGTRGGDGALDWGPSAGRPGADLAALVLCHATGRRPPEPACAEFRAEVIAALPEDGFVVSWDDVVLWLAAEQHDPRTWRRTGSPSLRRRLADALAMLGAPFGSAHPVR